MLRKTASGILFLLAKWIILINRLKLLEDNLLIMEPVWSGLISRGRYFALTFITSTITDTAMLGVGRLVSKLLIPLIPILLLSSLLMMHSPERWLNEFSTGHTSCLTYIFTTVDNKADYIVSYSIWTEPKEH